MQRTSSASAPRGGALARTERSAEDLGARRLAELDDRLLRIEHQREGASAPVARQALSDEHPVPAFDYFGFEVRMRGPSDEVRARQARYVDDFRDAAPVVDLGCGRGEFLVLLREAGIAARGVDIDADMVAFGHAQGLDVVEADALAHLDGVPNDSLGGIFAAQFAEHLPPAELFRLFQLAATKLRTGGVLVVETINPLSFVALRHFFADLTHSRPLVPDTLELFARHSGFRATEIRFVNEPPPAERLRLVELPSGPEFEEAREVLDANVRRLNEVVFGPQDYALVARK